MLCKWDFYNWKDVERALFVNRNTWIDVIDDIEVYANEVIVSYKTDREKEAKEAVQKVLDERYDTEMQCVYLDQGDGIPVLFEASMGSPKEQVIPLFKHVLFKQNAYDKTLLKETFDIPVIAFHSYKGGVGRTLSLLAFVKAWSENSGNQKLLIVDSDIEAPGLTWMLSEYQRENSYSYFDVLECIQQEENVKDIIDKIADKIERTTIMVETSTQTVEHYILPTYRYIEQLIDMYSTPETIADGYKKEFMLGKVLSELGKKIGASAVLVDLRAGISEFSAPLIFDPRVKKYVVTSTSEQSVKGCELLLEQINKGLPVEEQTNLPEILISMVTEDFDTTEITSELLSKYNTDDKNDSLTDNLITELPFASELIHLGNFQQIMKRLDGRMFYQRIETIVKDTYLTVKEESNIREVDEREVFIRKINDLANKQITAESNQTFNMLMTGPIQNLIKKAQAGLLNVVVLGAKGSGKTFLYRELLKSKFLESFIERSGQKSLERKTVFLPFLANKNFSEMTELLKEPIKKANEVLGLQISDNLWNDNMEAIQKFKEKEHSESEWSHFWTEQIKNSLKKDADTLSRINDYLGKKGKKVVFVVDGTEEIFKNTSKDSSEKKAISTLCQDVLNEVRLKYKNIGFIIFMRIDVMRNAISVNFEQFRAIYEDIQLNWSHKEALRLAVWLVDQANSGFYKGPTKIEIASTEIIEENLIRLWGKKLGKVSSNEAYTSRWVLGALSDFHGQLQARDIIRFLYYATAKVGTVYHMDRYIQPAAIKGAVPLCSNDKIDEIKDEIEALKPIFDKLKAANRDVKKLPFTSDTFDLTRDEEDLLKQEGYLKIDNGKYYIPEIIRYALEFQYGKGARPKVLSLMSIKTK